MLTFPIWRYTTFTENNVCLEDWGHDDNTTMGDEFICSGQKPSSSSDDSSFFDIMGDYDDSSDSAFSDKSDNLGYVPDISVNMDYAGESSGRWRQSLK